MIVISRPAGDLDARQGRLPGSRHLRHHHAGREAQLPRQGHRRHPRDRPRGLPHRHHRPPRPGPHRHPEGRQPGPFHRRPRSRRSICPAITPEKAFDIDADCRRGGRLQLIQAEAPGDPRRPGRDDRPRRRGTDAPRRRRSNCPVTTTLLGKGVFPETHDLSLGMLGMHGTAYANKAICECDLIINIGSRFDDRIIGQADKFGARREDHPHRHRPVRDGQDDRARTSRSSAMPRPR